MPAVNRSFTFLRRLRLSSRWGMLSKLGHVLLIILDPAQVFKQHMAGNL
jgi:hypothetical protein